MGTISINEKAKKSSNLGTSTKLEIALIVDVEKHIPSHLLQLTNCTPSSM